MNKMLKINIPFLKGRLHIAYPLISILQHPDGELFTYNHFINLECSKNNSDLNLCYVSQLERASISWMHYLNIYYCYHNFLMEKNMDLHSAIQDEINKGNYLYTNFDDFYLPHKKDIHMIHVNFIYGYDTNTKNYYSLGYDQHGVFKSMELPFVAVEKGYTDSFVETFRPNLNVHFSFSKELFLLQISDFIDSQNTLVSSSEANFYGFKKSDFIYGINVYKRIFEHLYNAKYTGIYDQRNLYQLYELSLLNQRRILYLKDHGLIDFSDEIISASNHCYQFSIMAQNLMLKYLLTKNEYSFNKCIDYLKSHQESIYNLYIKILSLFK